MSHSNVATMLLSSKKITYNLLASIREVLGEGATRDVLNAWEEAYEFLAEILIGRELQIYNQHASQPGGWQGFKTFRVERKEVESDVITSFYLKPADGSKVANFKPGQYITVRMPTPCGYSTTMRNYSLSDKPGQEWYRISIKREDGPKADAPEGYVSNHLHKNINVGDTLEIGPPCGEFFLDVTENHQRPLVLLAAGVGITPIFSMLLSALEAFPDRQIVFIHGSLSENTQAFKATLDDLAAKHSNLKVHYRYSEAALAAKSGPNTAVSTGLIDASLIASMVPDRDADYYFCGPQPFMVGIYHDLLSWGIPPAQVHFEFFGPRQELQKSLDSEKCPI